MEENTRINDLRYSPELRTLLIQYCLVKYEENAILSENNLIEEYNYLVKNNELNELFICEYHTISSLRNYN